MKKTLLLIMCVLAVSCNEQQAIEELLSNSKNDTEGTLLPESQRASIENKEDSLLRLDNIMDSVMNIANDLGLPIKLNREYTAKHLDEVNIDSIRALFCGLATIKGRYTLNVEKRN